MVRFWTKALRERIQVRLGQAPGCAWVQERLGAYCDWDLSLAAFKTVERHLERCPGCAAEYEAIREVCDALQAKRSAELDLATPETMLERVLDCIRAQEAGEPGRAFVPGRLGAPKWRPAAAIAATCLLLLAIPVLAYVGVQAWQAAQEEESGSGQATVAGTDAGPLGTVDHIHGDEVLGPHEAETPSAPRRDDAIGDSFERITTETFMAAQVETMLPHTEDEYEAWARKEYPHIMWLYDILTAVVEDDPETKPLWDGISVNIPDWAERLYADIPESDRPTGWRALVIGSGEIFKLDWPTNLDGPNCAPSIKAIQDAAAVAGYSAEPDVDGPFTLPPLPWLEFEDGDDGRPQRLRLVPLPEDGPLPSLGLDDIPRDYPKQLAGDVRLAKQTLVYVAVAAEGVGAPPWKDLAKHAKQVLGSLCIWENGALCPDTAQLAGEIERILDLREELITTIESTESRPRTGGR